MIRPTALAFAFALTSAAAAQGKNLLFYGNSFSQGNGGVPPVVRLIASEAGHPSPTVVSRLVGGQNLLYHATNPAQVAAISSSLPTGQTWDHVVMQGFSTEATNNIGNPAQFRSNAVAIMGNVKSHSPAAGGVMFQTWARAVGHSFYPTTFSGPLEMHDQIRANYRLAVADIDATFGVGTAVNAAVGDGAALFEFHPWIYAQDLYHAGPAMTLLAAMCIYTSIYGQTTCEIAPDFGSSSPLVLWLANRGLDERHWNEISGIADRCAAPAARRFPGSGDHLLLTTGTLPGYPTACPSNGMTTGTVVVMQLHSKNGVCDNAPGWLLFSHFPTGSPPGPSGTHPEIQVSLGTMATLATSVHLHSPLAFQIQVPFSWPGTSVLVQGLAWTPSGETGNPWFTTTDAHEFEFF